MLIPRLQQIKHALLAELNSISTANGAKYEPTIREIDESFSPQAPVEITLEARGFDYVEDDQTPIMHTSVHLIYQVNILCSHRLANENVPIDEICLVVCGDVEKRIMADPTHGQLSEWTSLDAAQAIDNLAEGYYAWALLFSVRATYLIDDPDT